VIRLTSGVVAKVSLHRSRYSCGDITTYHMSTSIDVSTRSPIRRFLVKLEIVLKVKHSAING